MKKQSGSNKKVGIGKESTGKLSEAKLIVNVAGQLSALARIRGPKGPEILLHNSISQLQTNWKGYQTIGLSCAQKKGIFLFLLHKKINPTS